MDVGKGEEGGEKKKQTIERSYKEARQNHGLRFACMPRSGRLANSSVIRKFAIYMNEKGGAAYVLPEKMYGSSKGFVPYIFTDDELRRLFVAIDSIHSSSE